MSEAIVKVEHLSHRYSVQWAVRDINFEISQTGIVGLLGSNGAGKSTIMNIICGVLSQTEGNVMIDGIDLRKNPVAAKQNIGFLPQKPPLYGDLTVDEYLTYAAQLRQMDPKAIPAALETAKEKCGISHFSKRLIKNLSGGYQQRVGIAQAIIHNPRLVVMDEPTNGLDIPSKSIFRRLLASYVDDSHMVVISTHQVADVEQLLDNIVILDQRGVALNASTSEITRRLKFGTAEVGDEVLYAERTIAGDISVMVNDADADTPLNIELLFNATVANRDAVAAIFANTKNVK